MLYSFCQLAALHSSCLFLMYLQARHLDANSAKFQTPRLSNIEVGNYCAFMAAANPY